MKLTRHDRYMVICLLIILVIAVLESFDPRTSPEEMEILKQRAINAQENN